MLALDSSDGTARLPTSRHLNVIKPAFKRPPAGASWQA